MLLRNLEYDQLKRIRNDSRKALMINHTTLYDSHIKHPSNAD